MSLNLAPLIGQLQELGIPANSIADADGTKADLIISYSTSATQAQKDADAAILAAYDFNNPYVRPSDDVQTRWKATAIHGMTPAQIYTSVQNSINSWTTLAQVKADLANWLPLIVAGDAWTVFEDQQR